MSSPAADPIFDRRLGALLGTFVGDAVGMPFELGGLCPPMPVLETVGLLHGRLPAGSYTDDTQLMIGVLQVLARNGELDEQVLAEQFLLGFDPVRGYGGGFSAMVKLWRQGVPAAQAVTAIFPDGSFGNGAAMRVAPVAAHFAFDDRLLDQVDVSARATHAHPLAIDGARALAAAIAAAVRGERDIYELLVEAEEACATAAFQAALVQVARHLHQGRTPVEVVEEIGNSVAAIGSVPAALMAALAASDVEQALLYALQCGGDTDTITAMAGALAGARFGASTIPAYLQQELENGEYGRDWLLETALSLWQPEPQRATG